VSGLVQTGTASGRRKSVRVPSTPPVPSNISLKINNLQAISCPGSIP
jgi:hypothetical protein